MSARENFDDLMEFIEHRWGQELVLNRYLGWRALSLWLVAEAMEARGDGDLARADDMYLLACIAGQYRFDLQPKEELCDSTEPTTHTTATSKDSVPSCSASGT